MSRDKIEIFDKVASTCACELLSMMTLLRIAGDCVLPHIAAAQRPIALVLAPQK